MANGFEVNGLTGNLGGDIELRESGSGTKWAQFSIAVTEYRPGRNGAEPQRKTEWVRCKIFGDYAANAASSLKSGNTVIFSGRMQTETWTTKEGQERSVQTLIISDIGPSLRFATATVNRTGGGGSYGGGGNSGGGYSGGGNSGGGQSRQPETVEDPWASASSSSSSNEYDPFNPN